MLPEQDAAQCNPALQIAAVHSRHFWQSCGTHSELAEYWHDEHLSPARDVVSWFGVAGLRGNGMSFPIPLERTVFEQVPGDSCKRRNGISCVI